MTAAATKRIEKPVSVFLGKTYELSLTKSYVSRWGLAEAIRELIQNALDSESPFVYEFLPDDDRWALSLTSEYTTLTPQTLLLGATSKGDAAEKIGSFGEGYKLALLVLTRLGHDVEMRNGSLLWKPRFRYSSTFGDDLLVIDETALAERNQGLTFLVRGLTEQDINAVRGSCLKMQSETGEVRRTEFGDILFDHPRKLYVGSLYICDTEMRFGYDIKPKYLRLERDRQTVSNWELSALTVKMWYATGDYKKVAKLIEEEAPDVEHARYDSNEMVKEECYRIFKERFPGKMIARSAEELHDKVKSEMTVYVGGGMYHAVSGSRGYRAEAPVLAKQLAPHEVMRAFLHDHRDEMRRKAIVAFKEMILKADKEWKLK